jgi:transcriptional regulator with XRE-family HTH domain
MMVLNESKMNNIRKLRILNNLSQKEFANIFHTSQASIARWESGTRIPDSNTLKSIASYFDVSIDYLLSDDRKTSIYIKEDTKGWLSVVDAAIDRGLTPDRLKKIIDIMTDNKDD